MRSGNGSFAVNGVSIAYNVNTDSLSTILSRINASSAGVTAAFDSLNDRVVFTNKTTGDLGLNLSEAAGGLVDALGLGFDFGAGPRFERPVHRQRWPGGHQHEQHAGCL
jgi:flagellar hook-associated protein 2